MNMSSPRSVRSTTIAGAIVITRSEEALAPVLLPAVLPVKAGDAVRKELVVVGAQERFLMRAALLDGQRAAEEVRGVPHRRSPSQRLPVDDRAGPVVEEHVVEPVVAVDEAERGPPIRVPGVGDGDEALADLGVLGGDAVPVALEEAGEQRGQERLVERGGLVQPVGRGERQVAEHRRVDPGQGHHRDPRLLEPAAGDLIALHAVRDVLEDEREPALLRVLHGQVAFRQRPVAPDPVAELAVEGDLAQVRAHADPNLAAVLVGGGELDRQAVRLAPRPAEGDPVDLAHLPGADRLDVDQLQTVGPEHGTEPLARDLVGRLDHAR